MAPSAQKTKRKNNADSGVDLQELLAMKMRIIYGVEAELLKIFSVMAKRADDADLKSIFEGRVDQAENQSKRILRSCELLGTKMQKIPTEAIKGLGADLGWLIKNIKSPRALDAALVATARSIGHYELAGYESAIEWAKILGKDEIADSLEQTIEEKVDTNEELGDLAELKIDERALPAGFQGRDHEEEEEDDDDDEDEDEDEMEADL